MREIYISVDVETSGPNPSTYSILSIGASIIGTTHEFYVELKPANDNYVREALEHCSFSKAVTERTRELGGGPEALMRTLKERGLSPEVAMKNFATWIGNSVGEARPVFVGFNTPFDWSFVNDYFHRFLGENPFSISGIDIKAYYMGMMRCTWEETTKRRIRPQFRSSKQHTHNALDDALEQAEMFAKMLRSNRARRD